MPQTIESCPLCGSKENSLFNRSTFLDRQITNRICDRCGLVFQSPRMTDEETEEFYKGEYRRMYHQGQERPSEKVLDVQRKRAAAMRKIAAMKVEKVSRHLEIGCSAGYLLLALKEQYGCTSVGIEPGNAYRDHAVQQGFTVYPSLVELQENKEEPFDLISMSHVLEHLTDPVGYLSDLRRSWLTPDGWLFLEVPNLYGHFSYEVAHLFSFTSHTLEQVIRKAGFRVVQLVKHGQPRSRTIPFYLNVLARPDSPGLQSFVVNPERAVRIKRFIFYSVRTLAYDYYSRFRRLLMRILGKSVK